MMLNINLQGLDFPPKQQPLKGSIFIMSRNALEGRNSEWMVNSDRAKDRPREALGLLEILKIFKDLMVIFQFFFLFSY